MCERDGEKNRMHFYRIASFFCCKAIASKLVSNIEKMGKHYDNRSDTRFQPIADWPWLIRCASNPCVERRKHQQDSIFGIGFDPIQDGCKNINSVLFRSTVEYFCVSFKCHVIMQSSKALFNFRCHCEALFNFLIFSDFCNMYSVASYCMNGSQPNASVCNSNDQNIYQ